MDFLSNFAKKDEAKPTSDQPDAHHNKPSNSDLFSSAKLVAEEAQCHVRGEPEKYDKGKVAGAAADLLHCASASEYGKLDESKGIAKYVDQAEDYLHKYPNTTNSTDSGENKTTTPTATTITTNPDDEDSSGGIAKYVDIADNTYLYRHPNTTNPTNITTVGDSGEKETTTTTATTITTNPDDKDSSGGIAKYFDIAENIYLHRYPNTTNTTTVGDSDEKETTTTTATTITTNPDDKDSSGGIAKYFDIAENFLHRYPNTTNTDTGDFLNK